MFKSKNIMWSKFGEFMTRKNRRQGFSLLELLVVILIIGILAAVALPQYQLSVDKADFMKYETMVRSLRDAYDHHTLIYGEGTPKFEDLSISLPDDFTKVYDTGIITCMQNSEMFCCMSNSGSSWAGLIDCGKNDLSVISSQSFLGYNNTPASHKAKCLAKENHSRANRLCNALGTKGSISNIWTPAGISNRYQVYVLK